MTDIRVDNLTQTKTKTDETTAEMVKQIEFGFVTSWANNFCHLRKINPLLIMISVIPLSYIQLFMKVIFYFIG